MIDYSLCLGEWPLINREVQKLACPVLGLVAFFGIREVARHLTKKKFYSDRSLLDQFLIGLFAKLGDLAKRAMDKFRANHYSRFVPLPASAQESSAQESSAQER